MTTTKKIWSEDVVARYPKQWIVFVEVECDPETNKYMGIVHSVTHDKAEAYETARALERSKGKKTVLEGFRPISLICLLSTVGIMTRQSRKRLKRCMIWSSRGRLGILARRLCMHGSSKRRCIQPRKMVGAALFQCRIIITCCIAKKNGK